MRRTSSSCPDVLLSRACRYTLSRQEEEQLAAHLRQCASCRITKLVAADFGRVPSVLPGDDQLIARVAGRLVRRPTVSRPHAWLVALVAAALLAFGTAAAALSARNARSHPISASPSALPSQSPAPSIGSVAIPTDPAPSVPEGDIAPVSHESVILGRGEGEREPGPVAHSHDVYRREHAEVTPKSLFAEANGLRAAGQVSLAIVRYRQLQELFPRSVEAMLSRVSTGNLLMGRNEAGPAVEQFKAYLSANPSGDLCEEALFGEARAPRALGRSAEEKETWNALVSAYPASVYAPVARARTQELR